MPTVLLGNDAPTTFVKDDETKAAGPDNGRKVPIGDGQNRVTTFTTFEAPADAASSIRELWRRVHSDADMPEWVECDSPALKTLLIAFFTAADGTAPLDGRPKGWKGVGA